MRYHHHLLALWFPTHGRRSSSECLGVRVDISNVGTFPRVGPVGVVIFPVIGGLYVVALFFPAGKPTEGHGSVGDIVLVLLGTHQLACDLMTRLNRSSGFQD